MFRKRVSRGGGAKKSGHAPKDASKKVASNRPRPASKQSAAKPQRTREQLFDDHALQFLRPGAGSKCRLVIGLDFGTSASKIVVQAPGLLNRPHWTVDFARLGDASMRTLSPSRLWISPEGFCSLDGAGVSAPENGAVLVKDIKLDLFDSPKCRAGASSPTHLGYDSEEVAAVYLGLLLRFTRTWLMTQQSVLLSSHSDLVWSVNLGVPSPSINDNEENRRFKRVGKAAWMLSLRSGRLSLNHARQEIRDILETPSYWDSNPDGITCRFTIVPEICAAAVGYAGSRARRDGLHIMMDFGASTVDACSFKLRRNDDDDNAYTMLTADVQQLGTIRVHQERIDAMAKGCDDWAKVMEASHDPLKPLGPEASVYLPDRQVTINRIAHAEEQLMVDCAYIVVGMVADLRTKRAPKDPAWKGTLPLLLTGGGSTLQCYRVALERLGTILSRQFDVQGITILDLQLPAGIGRNKQEGLRLAVAWGLSHPDHEIGDVTPMDQVSDVPPPPPPPAIDEEYTGPEQV